jgi:hypothetical protein
MLLPPLTACKVFLTLSAFLFWAGPALFILRHGQWRPPALFAALLLLPWVLCSPFFWGFLNYYSGVGLCFLALTHYLALRDRPGTPWLGLALHAALVTLLFFWHLAPFVIYGLFVACDLATTAGAAWIRQRRLWAGLARLWPFVLPLVPGLLLFSSYSLGNVGVNPAGGFNWGGWARKLQGPLALASSYDLRVDLASAGLWLAALVAAFRAPPRGQLRWGPLHLALVVLVLCYLAVPYELGSTSSADARLLPALLVCALAVLGAWPARRLLPAGVLLAACLLVRVGAIHHAWDHLSQRLSAQARALDRLEPGSRLLPVILTPEPSKYYPEGHFADWAVVLRGAFVPTLSAQSDQWPLSYTVRCDPAVRADAGAYRLEEGPIRACYDYVWVYNPHDRKVVVPDSFEQVHAEGPLTLWRVRPSSHLRKPCRRSNSSSSGPLSS